MKNENISNRLDEKVMNLIGIKSGMNFWSGRKEASKIDFGKLLQHEINYMIKSAKNYDDLNAIGLKLNYAIDNGYDIGITGLQVEASKKMREIYNKLGEYRE